jgi:hypothetical protein
MFIPEMELLATADWKYSWRDSQPLTGAMRASGDTMPHDPSVQRCIRICVECHEACLEALSICVNAGHAAPAHVRILLDCAEICQTSANFLMRNSDLHRQVCTACASTCAACASSCVQFPDDEAMKRCAEICLRCAEECSKLAGHSR